MKPLLDGLEELLLEDPDDWPKGQTLLRAFIATAAGGDWPGLEAVLVRNNVDETLNDLVLLFKYGAIGKRRPLRIVAELYRLLRVLRATTDVATTRDAVIAGLQAPLVVPRPLSGPLGPPGPRPPNPTGGNPTTGLHPPLADSVIDRLERRIADIERDRRASQIRNALTDAGVRDAKSVSAIMRMVATDVAVPFETANELERAALPAPVAAGQRVIQAYLYGVPVMMDVGAAQMRISRARSETARRLAAMLPAELRAKLEAAGVLIEDVAIWPDLLPSLPPPTPSYLEPAGRSDLLLVRQTTTGYRRTEIAYIENILIGETRNRQHTNRVLSRQEFFESVERESEETRDLQITDRAELSREVSQVVSENLKAQGSVEVTSRGPTTVVASAGVSFERSTEEAAKSAEEYSRETIERAVKRTLERVVRESRTLFEQETIEVNTHGFERDGDADEHVSGVYQYLERVSRAKMFWYGERELYDLLIPEPAALIWHLAISRKELQLTIEQPDEELFKSITLANIADRREEIIRAFRVTDMPPVPVASLENSASFSSTGSGDDAKHASSKELQIPEGYVASSAVFVASAEVEDEDDEPNGGVTVGGYVELWDMSLSGNKGSTQKDFTFTTPLAGPSVSVAFNADNFTSIVGSVTLKLTLTEEAKRNWALTAYGRVAERFEQLRREYAQALIQATASQPTPTASLPAGSRQRLTQIVRAELQRSAIDIMRNAPLNFDLIADFGYANPDGTLGTHPVADLPALASAHPVVRFLQQAFEWEHLAWVLYPYFWGRRSEWSRTVVVSHPDPDFMAFLNSGAARVQIPVRPGFEDMVKHFMETGEVYEGDRLPKMGDPGYVSFIDEQLTSLGAPGQELPWPPEAPREWDIVAPTSLVLVRPAKAPLPTWDPNTGDEQ